MHSAFEDIPKPRRRSERFLDATLVIASILAGLGVLDMQTNFLDYACGRWNFLWSFPLSCMVCLLVPLSGGVACLTFIFGMLTGNWLRRCARLFFVAMLAILVLIAPRRSSNTAYLDGLGAWARSLNAQAIRSAALAAVPANTPPTSPQYSWLLSDMDAPYGSPVAPAAISGLLGGYEPAEVRVVPKTQTIVAFRPSGLHKAYLATAPGLTGPPPEFDPARILQFRRVQPDVVIWLEETH